jgi:hypothetical protein
MPHAGSPIIILPLALPDLPELPKFLLNLELLTL